jgi:hypothetical protein
MSADNATCGQTMIGRAHRLQLTSEVEFVFRQQRLSDILGTAIMPTPSDRANQKHKYQQDDRAHD